MATTITAGNATNGLAFSADNAGILELKTGTGAGTTAVSIDASQNLAFNSGYGSAAVAYGCRAWVNFKGTGTVAIRASGNVTSITDNGTGNYTVNFTTAMVDANYACVATGDGTTSSTHCWVFAGSYTSSNVNLQMTDSAGTRVDPTVLSSSVFR